MNLTLKPLLPALMLLGAAGCMHLPADVAAELSAPDGRRPNNYAAPEGKPAAPARPQVQSP